MNSTRLARPDGRFLRFVMRLDQAGSSAFIVIALAAAPALALVPVRVVLWVAGIAVIAYAVALAVLGIFMAYGLSRVMARGEKVPDEQWRALLRYRPVVPIDVKLSSHG